MFCDCMDHKVSFSNMNISTLNLMRTSSFHIWNVFLLISDWFFFFNYTMLGDSLFVGPPLLLLSVLWWEADKGEWPPPDGGGVSPVKEWSGGMRPSFILFFCFILRFWNQILTWVSLSWRAPAISIRRALVRYLLKWNSFSNSVNCLVVKLVLPVLFTPPELCPG